MKKIKRTSDTSGTPLTVITPEKIKNKNKVKKE